MSEDNAPRHPAGRLDDEAAIRAMLNDLQVGVVISGPGADLRLCNRAALDLLDLTEAQLDGTAPYDPARSVIHEDGSTFSPETQPLAVALATGKPVRNIVMGVQPPRPSGSVWLLARHVPHLDAGDVMSAHVISPCDIPGHGFDARLVVSDRLAAMGTLAAGIAHEINNPLAYITANLSYADSELADPASLSDATRLAEIRHAILEAGDGAERVRHIVTELRTLARGDAPRRPISITPTLESAIGAVASEMRTRAKLVTRLADVPLVDADEARLGQVFINLLLNAADAIDEGLPSQNQITVTTSVDDGDLVLRRRSFQTARQDLAGKCCHRPAAVTVCARSVRGVAPTPTIPGADDIFQRAFAGAAPARRPSDFGCRSKT